jgi:hypothetical protein
MSDLLKRIDARTKLAGANKLEILLFTLGTDVGTGRKETFGINVFKVREVMRIPEITRAPDMPSAVEGMVSLRGVLVPVVDLGQVHRHFHRRAAGDHDRHRVQRPYPGFPGGRGGHHPASGLGGDEGASQHAHRPHGRLGHGGDRTQGWPPGHDARRGENPGRHLPDRRQPPVRHPGSRWTNPIGPCSTPTIPPWPASRWNAPWRP